MPIGKRKRIAIEPADEKLIIRELEDWGKTGDFIGLRLRAFVYLLWDGTVRTKAALGLRAQDVVADPKVLRVAKEIVQPPCEANRYHKLHFHISDRTRDAIADYLRIARSGGWMPHRFEGRYSCRAITVAIGSPPARVP